MFDGLSDKLNETFRKLRGQARITESNIGDVMRDIRVALLEADVNIQIVKEFIATVREQSLGESVLKSVTPGQQIVKIVNDELIKLMGESEAPLELPDSPSVIMMVGLHGSGKTTSSAKLANFLTQKKRKKVMLVAADVYRPAAVDQLKVLGDSLNIQVYAEPGNKDVAGIVQNALVLAKASQVNVVIVDTAGRLQIDTEMVKELITIKEISKANEVLLVADSALGQEAVSVATHFHEALDLTGIVLTKLDGDARGGAALSIRKVTGCPIKFIGVGEKIEDLEMFYPERLVSRLLGMGDIVSLVEKAAETIDEEESQKMLAKMEKNNFDFNDFLAQLKQMKKLGGLESILSMLPGGKQLKGMGNFDEKEFGRMEAIVLSMTLEERKHPEVINFSRRKRIAKGSGTSLEQVGQLIKQFVSMRKMIKKTGLLSRMLSGSFNLDSILGGHDLSSGLSALDGMGITGKMKRGSNVTPKKKKAKKQKNKKNKKKKKR